MLNYSQAGANIPESKTWNLVFSTERENVNLTFIIHQCFAIKMKKKKQFGFNSVKKHIVVCAFSLDSSFFSSTERQIFLATWKDIPNENESQFQIKDCHLSSGKVAWLEKKAHRLPSSWATFCFKKIQTDQFVNKAELEFIGLVLFHPHLNVIS